MIKSRILGRFCIRIRIGIWIHIKYNACGSETLEFKLFFIQLYEFLGCPLPSSVTISSKYTLFFICPVQLPTAYFVLRKSCLYSTKNTCLKDNKFSSNGKTEGILWGFFGVILTNNYVGMARVATTFFVGLKPFCLLKHLGDEIWSWCVFGAVLLCEWVTSREVLTPSSFLTLELDCREDRIQVSSHPAASSP